MWHVSSLSGVTTLRTAIHLLLTYLLNLLQYGASLHLSVRNVWAGHTVLVLRLSVAYDGSIYAAAAMRPVATVTVATCLIKRLGVATVRHPSYKVRPSDRVTDRILRHLSSDEQLAEN